MSGTQWTRINVQALTTEHVGWTTGASTLVGVGDGWRVWRFYDGELFLSVGEGEIDITPPPPPDPWEGMPMPERWVVEFIEFGADVEARQWSTCWNVPRAYEDAKAARAAGHRSVRIVHLSANGAEVVE